LPSVAAGGFLGGGGGGAGDGGARGDYDRMSLPGGGGQERGPGGGIGPRSRRSFRFRRWRSGCRRAVAGWCGSRTRGR
jgi:hypothetical protein